jgi:hypothetical protein
MRTPTSGAQSVVARFPQGRLLVVPGVGHSTVTADPSGCAVNAVRTWINGGVPPAACPRVNPLVIPVPALPKPGVAKPRHALSARATYTDVRETIDDAQALWLMTGGSSGKPFAVPGVYGGTELAGGRTIKLVNYAIAHGVTVSGTLTYKSFGPPLVFQGAVTVGGPAAAHGVLGLNGASLKGSLGGRAIG